jgi:hypothetical protein
MKIMIVPTSPKTACKGLPIHLLMSTGWLGPCAGPGHSAPAAKPSRNASEPLRPEDSLRRASNRSS